MRKGWLHGSQPSLIEVEQVRTRSAEARSSSPRLEGSFLVHQRKRDFHLLGYGQSIHPHPDGAPSVEIWVSSARNRGGSKDWMDVAPSATLQRARGSPFLRPTAALNLLPLRPWPPRPQFASCIALA